MFYQSHTVLRQHAPAGRTGNSGPENRPRTSRFSQSTHRSAPTYLAIYFTRHLLPRLQGLEVGVPDAKEVWR